MNLELIGGISFGILAIYYSIYLLKEYYFDVEKEKTEDFSHLPKGLVGLILVAFLSLYCFYQFFQ
jgi:hypothetical protein